MNPTRKTVLIVEDEQSIREGLEDAIQNDGHETITASNGVEAIERFQENSVDLVLLDIMMPLINGYDVCRKIREIDKQTPILMLTAKTEEIDHVLGLELGADDYIAKPFRIRELLARIHAAFRRQDLALKASETSQSNSELFEFGSAKIDCKRFLAQLDEQERELTHREVRLLEIFHSHPNQALSRDFLLNEAWGIDYMGTTRTLDQHIAKLRAKIDRPNEASSIKTVHGVGYKYVV